MSYIKQYLDYHQNAWSPTTLESEAARLKSYVHLTDPSRAYAQLAKRLKPYTIKTVFIRLAHYHEWLRKQGLEEGPNQFQEYLKIHANKFKHVYSRKEVNIDYNTALQRIRSLSAQDTRAHAEFLLKSGLRISESYQVKDGYVVGKGSKPRKVFADPPKTLVPKKRLREALTSIGLKPHDLRKLCATNLVRQGADAATLCHVMGWSKITTAYNYLQPFDDSKIKEMLNG